MKPFLKWPGGKSSELVMIHQYMPQKMNNYIEPFLGGGASFLSLKKEQYSQAFLNDFSFELIALYQLVKEKNLFFKKYLHDIWSLWNAFGQFSEDHVNQLRELYSQYKRDQRTLEQVKMETQAFLHMTEEKMNEFIPTIFAPHIDILLDELNKGIVCKFTTIKRNEQKKGDMPEDDYAKNIEASLRGSLYTFFRSLYNKRETMKLPHELHIALFFYLREFCYSSMFRYNRKGEFNVPYGGASYNRKAFIHKINYLFSERLQAVLKGVQLFQLDFQDFFQHLEIQKDDFIFLDPPYDSDFSTYAQNSFTTKDQIRLADYLVNQCPGRFMVIIKNTDFIYELYNKQGIHLIGFNKSYSVSFMDRNDKKVEHLLIRNYC